jgi:acetyltransferase-like isoleucine patch superfamily enzyme
VINNLVYRPLFKLKLKKVGDNFRFGYSSNLEPPSSFEIGDNFFSGPYAYFSSNNKAIVKIGNDVMFGPRCMVIAGNHNISDYNTTMRLAPKLWDKEVGIIIENDVWVGAGSTLLDGSYISEGCVIAAGAVVTGKTVPYSVYGGVPAKYLKPRFTKDEQANILINNKSKYNLEDLLLQLLYEEKLKNVR